MKQIKTLTVNGERYQITDPTAARMDEVVERLCPAFRERGPVVQCTPVAGQPLTVTSHIQDSDTVTLYHCGKNLFDINTKFNRLNNGSWSVEDGVLKVVGFAVMTGQLVAKPSTTYTISYKSQRTGPKGGGAYIRSYNADGEMSTLIDRRDVLNGSFSFTTKADTRTLQIIFYGNRAEPLDDVDYSVFSEIQLEVGNTATAYEPYCGEEHTAEFGKTVTGEYDWATGVLTDAAGNARTLTPQVITAGEGINVLCSDAGDTTVAGSADPVAVLEKLTNAIIALGGNV